MEKRKVTVYATRGQNNKVIETDAEVWGDLKDSVIEAGFDLDRLEAAESVGKTTLKHKEAKLPESDFILFLRPIDSKAGTDKSYAELKALAKENEGYRNFVENMTGKNYTQVKTVEFRKAYDEFFDSELDLSETEPETDVYQDIEVHDTQEVAPSTPDNLQDVTPTITLAKQKVEEAMNCLTIAFDCLQMDQPLKTGNISDVVDSVKADKEAEEARIAEEQRLAEEKAEAEELARQKEAEEKERLAKEARDFMKGF